MTLSTLIRTVNLEIIDLSIKKSQSQEIVFIQVITFDF